MHNRDILFSRDSSEEFKWLDLNLIAAVSERCLKNNHIYYSTINLQKLKSKKASKQRVRMDATDKGIELFVKYIKNQCVWKADCNFC